MRYIALLRGINVGGKNKISMPELKTAFEEAGLTEVTTYINSGNILFTSEESEMELIAKCEAVIKKKFSLTIPVTVISAPDLAAALQNAPAWWGEDETAKHNAIFVILPANAEDIAREVGETKPEYEKIGIYGQVVFWSAPIKTFSRTRWSKITGTAAYNSITIRNANTTKKLAAMANP